MLKMRLNWVDNAKGIGILLVVLGHAFQGVIDSEGLTNTSNIYFIKELIYGFHMPLFFLLSGLFYFSFQKKNIKQALFSKLYGLIRPYFIWAFITAVIMQLGSRYTNAGLGITDFFKSPIVPFSQLWFLYVLFFMFILTRILLLKLNLKMLWIVSFIFLLLNPFLPNIWIIKNLSFNFFYFISGYVLMENKYIKERIFKIMDIKISLLLFTIMNILFYFIVKSDYVTIYSFYKLILPISGILLVLNISEQFKSKFIAYLGKNSMPIYVMHLIILAVVRVLLLKILEVESLLLVIALSTIISVVLSLIGLEIAKKLKLDRYFF